MDYSPWKQGKEYKTEFIEADGATVKRRIEDTWENVFQSWWAGLGDQAPSYNSRIQENRVTLVDNTPDPAQVSRTEYFYDTWNNRTLVKEYDYGSGAPGTLRRQTETAYITTNNGVNYATTESIHLRSLISRQTMKDSAGVRKAETTYEYDNYVADATHAALVNRTSVVGQATGFGTGYSRRGNATAGKRWLDTSGGQIESYQQYDILGNVVKRIDPRGYSTTLEFTDRFGLPGDGNVTGNTAPSELGATLKTFAFATQATNPLGHLAYTH